MFEKNQIFKWGYQISREPDKILEYKEVQVIRIPMINREQSSSITSSKMGHWSSKDVSENNQILDCREVPSSKNGYQGI